MSFLLIRFNKKSQTMKKIFILLLTFTLISCVQFDSNPTQEVTPSNDATDIIAYAPGEYDQDSVYYCLTTRYQDCRIRDYGTANFIDSIMPIRYQDIIDLQAEYDGLQEHARQSPKHQTYKLPPIKSAR
jgi:hypothetical protein